MNLSEDIAVKWVGFSAILNTTTELLISSLRKAVLDSIEDKVFNLILSWLEAQPSNICFVELQIHALPHDTDFHVPSLATTISPSLKHAPILSEPTAEGSGSSSTGLDLDTAFSNPVNNLNSSSTDIRPMFDRTQPPPTAYQVVMKTYEHNMDPPKAPSGRKIGFLLDKPARHTLQYSHRFSSSRKEFKGG
ncbi:hypothetical protein F4805DRAFT_314104 [Annulohypoxylon moriforme]|nr:hypothetical protein F4805DRAFT_314104 [Annulohypoxylon moriforme]